MGFSGRNRFALRRVLAVCIMRTMKSVDLIREAEAAGWVLDRVRGSHHVFRHPTHPGPLSIPHPKKDLGTGLSEKIRKQIRGQGQLNR
jgi:predicted RNA binding protein YcfA (HicA-like mRNA interferase family)